MFLLLIPLIVCYLATIGAGSVLLAIPTRARKLTRWRLKAVALLMAAPLLLAPLVPEAAAMIYLVVVPASLVLMLIAFFATVVLNVELRRLPPPQRDLASPFSLADLFSLTVCVAVVLSTVTLSDELPPLLRSGDFPKFLMAVSPWLLSPLLFAWSVLGNGRLLSRLAVVSVPISVANWAFTSLELITWLYSLIVFVIYGVHRAHGYRLLPWREPRRKVADVGPAAASAQCEPMEVLERCGS